MQIDIQADKAMLATARAPHIRRPWLQLLSAVMELAGSEAELLRHAEKPWASVTFTGSRHAITLAFTGGEAAVSGEEFIAALPEHEFSLARQIVADAAVLAVEHVLVPAVRMVVEIELLLLEDG